MDKFRLFLRRNKSIYYFLLKIRGYSEISTKIFLVIIFMISNKFRPVKPNKIICRSYNNNVVSCNPKYISKYILENLPRDSYEIVWIVSDLDTIESGALPGVRFVRFSTIKYAFEMSNAKFIIYNKRMDFMVPKRKNQVYVQMWHSSARLKKIEGDASKNLSRYYLDLAKKDSKKIDLMVSGSRHSTDIYRRAFWYNGEILNIGTPRNDMLIKHSVEEQKAIKEKLGIPISEKIILYVPTFRTNYKFDYSLFEGKKVEKALKTKFSGEWNVLKRYHPNLYKEKFFKDETKNVRNVSSYYDIQELLLVADCIITDYSSVMFDYCLTLRPIFLFVPDIDTYFVEDREFYFKIEEIPFTINKSMEELVSSIHKYDDSSYKSKVKSFLNRIGSFEDGMACERFINYIERL